MEMLGRRGTMFPVVFFNGKKEVNMGCVKVDPSMEYKSFKLVVSEMIKKSPNQISIYLIDDPKKSTTLPAESRRRRLPITGKANFAVIFRERNCSFLAVPKRNRRSKHFHGRVTSEYDNVPLESNSSSSSSSSSWSESNKYHYRKILRQKAAELLFSDPAAFNKLKLESMDIFNKESLTLRFWKPRTSSILTSSCDCECNIQRFPAPLSAAEFHCCVNDPVVFNFRSPAGPIAPPLKTL